MTAPRVTVLLGSREGPVSLCDEVFGRRLRAQLRNHGVAYQSVRSPGTGTVDPAESLASEIAQARAAAGRCDAVLASAEGAEVAALDAFLEAAGRSGCGPSDVRVLSERQDRLAEYALLTPLRTGGEPVEDEFTHDHAKMSRTLLARPDVAAVTASPYEQIGAGVPAWVDAQLDALGLRGRLDLRGIVHLRTPPRVRRYCSPTGLELGRALRDEFTAPAEREQLYAFLVSAFPAGDARLLDGAVRDGIVARHRGVNREFLAEFGDGLDPGAYDDDAATARLAAVYPPVRVPSPKVTHRARRAMDIARDSVRERLHLGD